MYLKRKADEYLEDWYKDPDRKPLIVKGARQVGKTKTIREFAGKHYDSIIEINFFTHPNYKGITEEGYSAFAAEALVKQGYDLYYYKRENSTLEEDFFVRSADDLIPVEIKSGKDQSKSMKELIDNENYPDIKYGIKFMSGNIGITDKVKTFPHFCMFLLKRYIEATT